MITTIIGGYALFTTAVASTAWWLYTLNGLLRFSSQQKTTGRSSFLSRPHLPRLRLHFSPLEWLVAHAAGWVKTYLLHIRVNQYTVLFVYVIQPLVVIGGITNKVGSLGVGYLMLAVVVINWVMLSVHIWRQRDQQIPPPARTRWEQWVELMMYVVPVVYTWYQFFSTVG